MHCYLHIGTEKTGTTLIQDFLHLNAEKLKARGLGYLRSAGYPNNMWAVIAAYDLDRRDRWTESRKVTSDQEMQELQQSIVEGMREELSQMKIGSIVLSSEHIQSRLTRRSEIERLKIILEGLGVTSFSVIVYLRDPIEVAASLYSTAVKSGSTNERPSLPSSLDYAQICNHQVTIENFKAVFNNEEDYFIIRLFVKNELKNRSVLNDFLSILGIEDVSCFDAPAAENKSLSGLGVELLRRVNKRIPNLNERSSIKARKKVVMGFDKYFTDVKYIMPAELYIAYDERFRESNEWVREKFFPQKDRLFPQKSLPEAQLAYEDITHLDKIADLLAKAWLRE